MRLLDALEGFERNLESSPGSAAQAWDAVTQLIGPLSAPQFAAVPEVATTLARHARLAPRAASELAVRLASERARPAVDDAVEEVAGLVRAIDNADLEAVRRRRAGLRRALERLPRAIRLDEVTAVEAAAVTAFRRSEDEIGEQLVVDELIAIERSLEPMLDQVLRGLADHDTDRVVAHAPRLRDGLPQLAWYEAHTRARRFADCARSALDRIATELGADTARAVEEADAVPAFGASLAEGSRIEAAVRRIDDAFASYRASYLEAQTRFDAEVDLVSGTPDAATSHVIDEIDRAAREMVRAARRAEELAGELDEIASGHRVVGAVRDAVPGLIRRVQDWKSRLSTLSAFSNAIDEARQWLDQARDAVAAGAPTVRDALMTWPEVLEWLANIDAPLATAEELVPDEPERVHAMREAAAALRVTAIAELAGACIAEATRNATLGDMDEAQRFVDALQSAAPDAPENQQLAAVIAGTADAREQAALEIEAHGALIRRCAEDAARAARPAFDAWVAERPPVAALAGTIVANIDWYRGRFVADRCSHLGLALADEPWTIRGDVYQVDYDPDVRRQLADGIAKLDGMFASGAEQTAAAAGVTGLRTTTQHYPSGVQYLAEIVGVATYSPVHEVRDEYGKVLYAYPGAPYQVPRVVIRAVATSYFVVVPGEPPSLDAMAIGSA